MCTESINDTRRSLLAGVPATLAATLAASLSASLAASSGEAQDAVRAQPGNYKVVLENSQVRVLEYNSRPGMGVCGDGIHSHPAHLTVMLTPAKVHVIENGHNLIGIQKEGDVFWSEPVTHETENLTGADVRCLIIELKRG